MLNTRLYGFWGSLTEALRTGEPQNEAKQGGDIFDALYKDPAGLEGFLRAMSGQTLPVARKLAEVFPWKVDPLRPQIQQTRIGDHLYVNTGVLLADAR